MPRAAQPTRGAPCGGPSSCGWPFCGRSSYDPSSYGPLSYGPPPCGRPSSGRPSCDRSPYERPSCGRPSSGQLSSDRPSCERSFYDWPSCGRPFWPPSFSGWPSYVLPSYELPFLGHPPVGFNAAMSSALARAVLHCDPRHAAASRSAVNHPRSTLLSAEREHAGGFLAADPRTRCRSTRAVSGLPSLHNPRREPPRVDVRARAVRASPGSKLAEERCFLRSYREL